MKLLAALAAAGLVAAAPAVAQHVTRTTTTVERVHGPVKLLPHHKRKICTYTRLQGRRVKKCHFR